MKKTAALFAVLIMAVCMVMPAFAAESRQRVYDLAGLYSESETAQLESELAAAVDETGMDAAVLTTFSKDGKAPLVYADDIYFEKGLGTGDDLSGVMLLIDMEDRSVYMYTRGNAVNYYNDARILDLTDNNDVLYDCLSAGQYLAGTLSVVDGIREYYRKGIVKGQHTYNEDTGETLYQRPVKKISVFEIIAAVVIAGVCGFLYTGSIKKKYAMKAEKNNSAGYLLAYRADSAFAFATVTDKLINESVTHRIIPVAVSSGGSGRDSSQGRSTIHTSSHGGSFGGGGGGRHF